MGVRVDLLVKGQPHSGEFLSASLPELATGANLFARLGLHDRTSRWNTTEERAQCMKRPRHAVARPVER